MTFDSPADNEDGSDSEVDLDAPRMRVGEDYQAEIPDLLSAEERKEDLVSYEERDVLRHVQHWDPKSALTDSEIEEFLQIARKQHGYSVEQALGFLHCHDYNVDAASQDLPNFTPFPDEWSKEEEVIFQQAFKSHGKTFRRIRTMLTQKSIPDLVQHYYQWKKRRSHSSVTDQKTGSHLSERHDANMSDGDDIDKRAHHSDSGDSNFDPGKDSGRRLGKAKRTNLAPDDHPMKKRLRLPKGMHLDPAQLVELANNESKPSVSENPNTLQMQKMTSEIVREREQIQLNKQHLSELESQLESVEHLRQTSETSHPRASGRWTSPEVVLLMQCVRRYGKDPVAMAAVIGTKTEHQCKNYLLNNYTRLNVDGAFAEFKKSQAALGNIVVDNEDSGVLAVGCAAESAGNVDDDGESEGDAKAEGDDAMQADTSLDLDH